jgi:hypothetical protein
MNSTYNTYSIYNIDENSHYESNTNNINNIDESETYDTYDTYEWKEGKVKTQSEVGEMRIIQILNKKFQKYFENEKKNYSEKEINLIDKQEEDSLLKYLNLNNNQKEENKKDLLSLQRNSKGGVFKFKKKEKKRKTNFDLTKRNLKLNNPNNNYYIDNDTDHRCESSVDRPNSNSKCGMRSFSYSPDCKNNLKFDKSRQNNSINNGNFNMNNSQNQIRQGSSKQNNNDKTYIEVISEDEEILSENKLKLFKKSIVKNHKFEKRVEINLEKNEESASSSFVSTSNMKSMKKSIGMSKNIIGNSTTNGYNKGNMVSLNNKNMNIYKYNHNLNHNNQKNKNLFKNQSQTSNQGQVLSNFQSFKIKNTQKQEMKENDYFLKQGSAPKDGLFKKSFYALSDKYLPDISNSLLNSQSNKTSCSQFNACLNIKKNVHKKNLSAN